MTKDEMLQLEYEAFIKLLNSAGIDPYQPSWPEEDVHLINLLIQLSAIDEQIVAYQLKQANTSDLYHQAKNHQATLRQDVIRYLKQLMPI